MKTVPVIAAAEQVVWTGAAVTCFASLLVRRDLNGFAPPGQLLCYAASLMPTMIYYLGLFAVLVAVIVAVSIPLTISDERKRKRKIKSAFADRASLDDDAFFNKYFASRGVPIDVVCRIRGLLASDLDADVSRLQPEDDFTGNLEFFFIHNELANVYIVQDLEKEFGISITDDEAARMHTFDDIVMATWAKLRPRAA